MRLLDDSNCYLGTPATGVCTYPSQSKNCLHRTKGYAGLFLPKATHERNTREEQTSEEGFNGDREE